MASPEIGQRILEIGAGPGNRLASLSRRGDVVAIDLVPSVVGQSVADGLNIEYRQMDAACLRFDTCSFDEVHAYDVLEHVEDIEKCLSEISRVLKPNGIFRGEVPHPKSESWLLRQHPKYWQEVGHLRCFSSEVLRQYLGRAGLCLERIGTKNGAMSLQIAVLFALGGRVTGQRGELSNGNRWFNAGVAFFLDDVFRFPIHKWLFPIWVLTYPIGRVATLAMPKSIYFLARKCGE